MEEDVKEVLEDVKEVVERDVKEEVDTEDTKVESEGVTVDLTKKSKSKSKQVLGKAELMRMLIKAGLKCSQVMSPQSMKMIYTGINGGAHPMKKHKTTISKLLKIYNKEEDQRKIDEQLALLDEQLNKET